MEPLGNLSLKDRPEVADTAAERLGRILSQNYSEETVVAFRFGTVVAIEVTLTSQDTGFEVKSWALLRGSHLAFPTTGLGEFDREVIV